jgi:hypothetical protein
MQQHPASQSCRQKNLVMQQANMQPSLSMHFDANTPMDDGRRRSENTTMDREAQAAEVLADF